MIEPTGATHHYCPSDPDGEPVALRLLSALDLPDRRIRAYTCPGCNTLIHVSFPPSYEAGRAARFPPHGAMHRPGRRSRP